MSSRIQNLSAACFQVNFIWVTAGDTKHSWQQSSSTASSTFLTPITHWCRGSPDIPAASFLCPDFDCAILHPVVHDQLVVTLVLHFQKISILLLGKKCHFDEVCTIYEPKVSREFPLLSSIYTPMFQCNYENIVGVFHNLLSYYLCWIHLKTKL